jgi:DNA modification methylase
MYQHKAVAIEQLIPYALNSRTHSDEQVAQLAASIREFGFTNPVLVDEENNLIAGHGCVMAARKLGLTEVPAIIVTGMDDRKRRALIIADNKLALNANWDEQALRVELEDLAGDYGALMGFSEDELAALLAEAAQDVDGQTDEDAVPELAAQPVTVMGDLWVMGKHRLMCGDSTSMDAVDKLMSGVLADMLLTDPPYNVDMTAKNEMLEKAGKARKNKETFGIQNDAMSDGDFRKFLRDVYATADAVMRPGAVFYIWHADMESYNFRGACLDVGWKVRQCLVWVKSVFAIGRNDYHWKHEPCLYGWKDGAAHTWESDRKQTTVLNFDKPASSGLHPTTKPVELFEYQMLNNTKSGGVVLDLFGGSGTTAIAAEKNGRQARLMELDPKYCDVIVKRWQEFTGKKATLEATGQTFDEVCEQPDAQEA